MKRRYAISSARIDFCSGLFGYGTWYLDNHLGYAMRMEALICLGFAGVCAWFATINIVFFVIPQSIRYWWVGRIRNRAGSAGWANFKDIKRAKLHTKSGFLAGMFNNKKPLFVEVEFSGLVLSPAGGGKTVSFVIPALCHNPMSMIVPDLKGILACMMAKYREKHFKHQSIILNPAGLYADILGEGSRYNPLEILKDNWADPKLHNQLFADAQSIAKQLHPDPPTEGENQYFRNGSRKFLIFTFTYLVTMTNSANLSQALSLLSDSEALNDALLEASMSNVLSGDLARFAKDLLTKIESGEAKQIESFREGEVQSLADFSPSGALAAKTEQSDFRFSDLREKGITVYIIADPTRATSYATWLGLVSWCALNELIRNPKGSKVCMLCDEVTNFCIKNLPSNLTLVREFGIVMWFIVQELDEWAKTYGRESLETLLSQTDAKIIMGSSSFKTCKLVSDMLGEQSILSKNYNLGTSFFSPISKAYQEHGRRLLTPDEVRRFGFTILFYRNHRPVKLNQIGYHEIRPWSRKVGINPLFGKRYKGRSRLRI